MGLLAETLSSGSISPIRFAHSVVRTDSRVMILSVCARCDRGQLVSRADGSMDEWEKNHCCDRPGIAPVPDPEEGM